MASITFVILTKDNPLELERSLSSLQCIPINFFKTLIISKSKKNLQLEKNIVSRYQTCFSLDFKIQLSNGIFPAMNEALSFVTTPWLLFLNSGDYICDGQFVSGLSEISPAQFDAIFYQARIVSGENHFLSVNPVGYTKSKSLYRFLFTYLHAGFYPCHQAIIFSTTYHLNHMYSHELLGSDQEIISNLLNCSSIKLVDNIVVTFYADGVSSVPPPSYTIYYSQAKSSLQLGQSRRFFALTFKFLIKSSYLFNLLRRLRYYFSFVFLFLLKFCIRFI